VKITPVEDPITAGLSEFDITDELYFRQDGTEPIEPLIAAHSKITGRDEPLAWKYTYGKGRVFQTLLGHSEQTYQAYEACEMLRRAVAWCAAREVREFARTSASSQ
jgi:type 1 glutamine amidotransferase